MRVIAAVVHPSLHTWAQFAVFMRSVLPQALVQMIVLATVATVVVVKIALL